MRYKVIVFDLGGTLMEYRGMPLSWVDYYENGLRNVNSFFNCRAKEQDIKDSVSILKSFNPRIKPRELEYSAEYIFKKALEHWKYSAELPLVIDKFLDSFDLCPVIYDDSVETLKELKRGGIVTAALTDLPSAMPDRIFKSGIGELLQYIDIYVSSESCGYRKPNAKGILNIAEKCGINVDEILFAGDEEKDRLTAENAGCDFVFIERSGRKDGAVHRLKEKGVSRRL